MAARLRAAGVEPGDADDLKIKKQLLLFAMGLMTAAPMLWNALYGYFGLQTSAAVPFAYQVISLATLLLYLSTGNFTVFRASQQVLFLFDLVLNVGGFTFQRTDGGGVQVVL